MTIEILQSPSPLVSIIIPATSTIDLLLGCLRSLARFAPDHIPFETIVVLNNASAEMESRLREGVTGIVLVCSSDNLGLAGAANRGRAIARGEYLIVLHDDAEIEAGWMENLVETARSHPEAGAVGGKVLHPDGRLQNAGMILWSDATTSPPWVGETPSADAFDRLRAVDYCGTSSLLVRAVAWDAVGGLDENFYPVYYVDVDLSMALRQLGYVVYYQPTSRIRHHRGASTAPRFRTFVVKRNRELFQKKWEDALKLHEPFEAGSWTAIQRATARADALGSSRRNAEIVPFIADRKALDGPGQQHHLLRLRCATQEAYIAELEAQLESETSKSLQLAAELAAIKRSRLLRLGQMLRRHRWWRFLSDRRNGRFNKKPRSMNAHQ